jgi:hypothetical protein
MVLIWAAVCGASRDQSRRFRYAASPSTEIKGIVAILATADPEDRKTVYNEPNLALTYRAHAGQGSPEGHT